MLNQGPTKKNKVEDQISGSEEQIFFRQILTLTNGRQLEQQLGHCKQMEKALINHDESSRQALGRHKTRPYDTTDRQLLLCSGKRFNCINSDLPTNQPTAS